ncbi:glycosyltransferase family 4 protein [Clostridium perfringens]|nr:glycosyltransferase family 1 protein [Clostridium perfringens]EHK2403249.1 glycosyltransferase family 4 protein [Clostridium perfringens]
MKKNIIIDARMVNEELHGIGRYTYELVKGLINDERFNVKLLVNDKNLAEKIFGDKCVGFIVIKSKFLSISEIIEIPAKVNNLKDYIYYTPSFSCSPFIKLESYITLHDLNHLALPQYYSKFHGLYYRFIVKPFSNKCKKIFTVSNFSKKEILKWLKCKDEKIIVTYNGIDEKFRRINDLNLLNLIKEKYNLPEKFVLYIGNQKPHKNLETLIKAMVNVNSKLVINGKPCVRIQNLIKELNIEEKIEFIGYVDDNDLPLIYNLASVFVFPSLYEGFGLPAIEAMTCGCQTIVANSEALIEVTDGNAILFDKLNHLDLSNKINVTLNHYNVVKFENKFSWNTMVYKTLKELL